MAICAQGGIGKSTIALNAVTARAGMGKQVMDVGGESMADSVRMPLGGVAERAVRSER